MNKIDSKRLSLICPALVVRKVRNGRGIVAKRAFDRGDILFRVNGKLVTAEAVWSYWITEPRRAENCFRYDSENYIDPDGELGQFANHSCNPNAGIVKQGNYLWMVAIDKIHAGDEITHDYSTLLAADDEWEMNCNCGESSCRQVIKRIVTLPSAIIDRYKTLGVIPEFILKIKFALNSKGRRA